MRPLLFILSALAMLTGFGFSAAAKSAIHEIEAFLFYLIAAVLFCAFALLHAIIRIRESLDAQQARLASIHQSITKLSEPPKPVTPSESPSETFVVQLNDGSRGNFTREQIGDLLQRGSIDQGTWILPPGTQDWVRLSQLTATKHH